MRSWAMNTPRPLLALPLLLFAVPALAAGAQQAPDAGALVDGAIKVGLAIFAVMFPVAVAFVRKDRDAMEKLLASIPAAWDVVQQERRRAKKPTSIELSAAERANQAKATSNAIGRALEVVAQVAPKALVVYKGGVRQLKSEDLMNRAEVELRAHHERMHAAGLAATPVLPIPVVPKQTVQVSSSGFTVAKP